MNLNLKGLVMNLNMDDRVDDHVDVDDHMDDHVDDQNLNRNGLDVLPLEIDLSHRDGVFAEEGQGFEKRRFCWCRMEQ